MKKPLMQYSGIVQHAAAVVLSVVGMLPLLEGFFSLFCHFCTCMCRTLRQYCCSFILCDTRKYFSDIRVLICVVFSSVLLFAFVHCFLLFSVFFCPLIATHPGRWAIRRTAHLRAAPLLQRRSRALPSPEAPPDAPRDGGQHVSPREARQGIAREWPGQQGGRQW